MDFGEEIPFLDVVELDTEPLSNHGISPLARVHHTQVQGYLTHSAGTNGSYFRLGSLESNLPTSSGVFSCQHTMSKAKQHPTLPAAFESGFCMGDAPVSTGLDQDQKRAGLHSVDSAMSTVEYPHTPGKLFTEPARMEDVNLFNIQTLDFLNDGPAGHSEATRSVRLKLATAPAEFRVGNSRPESSWQSTHTTQGGLQHSGSKAVMPPTTPAERVSRSSSAAPSSIPPIPPSSNIQRIASGNGSDPERSVGLADMSTGSLPNVSSTSGQQGTEEWARAEVKRAFERTSTGTNPRKTEQNRRAQARFRQRKKDMFVEQQRQIQELTSKLEKVMKEKQSYQEKTSLLQQMVQAKEKRIEALKSQGKDGASLEDLVDACWEFVAELKRGRQGLTHTRETVAEMVQAMLDWGSPALGFMRREVVEQLAECLKQNGEQLDTPANLWMNDLVNAYERMVHRCGESHPQAFRVFLGLQLPEQNGRSADVHLWRKVLEAGHLKAGQKQQLANARNSLVSKMQQLVARRRDLAGMVQSGGPEEAINQQPLLGNMAKAQQVLDLHAQILMEEQAAVFNFLTIVRLVLEPVQQARLMVSSFPFALDTLAICSLIADEENSLGLLHSNMALMSQLPSNSPFQALTPNSMPSPHVQRAYA